MNDGKMKIWIVQDIDEVNATVVLATSSDEAIELCQKNSAREINIIIDAMHPQVLFKGAWGTWIAQVK